MDSQPITHTSVHQLRRAGSTDTRCDHLLGKGKCNVSAAILGQHLEESLEPDDTLYSIQSHFHIFLKRGEDESRHAQW